MIKCTDGDGGGSVALLGLCLENLIGLMIGSNLAFHRYLFDGHG